MNVQGECDPPPFAAVGQPGKQRVREPLPGCRADSRQRREPARGEFLDQARVAAEQERHDVVADPQRAPLAVGSRDPVRELGQAHAVRGLLPGPRGPHDRVAASQGGRQQRPPGALRCAVGGDDRHRPSAVGGDERADPEARAEALRVPRRDCDHRDGGGQCPAGGRGGLTDQPGVRPPRQQQPRQLTTQAVTLAGARRLLGGVALGAGRRQLVHVDEDRLTEGQQLLGGHPRPPGQRGEVPVGHARADAVGGEQGGEGASLNQFPGAEADVDGAVRAQGRGGGARQLEEAGQRHLHAEAQVLAEAALDRPGVTGHLGRDGAQNVVHHARQIRPE